MLTQPNIQNASAAAVETAPGINQMIALICEAIIESVAVAGPLGAPAGTLYAALMAHGCTLDQFNSIMGALVRIGKLRQQGNLYFVAK